MPHNPRKLTRTVALLMFAALLMPLAGAQEEEGAAEIEQIVLNVFGLDTPEYAFEVEGYEGFNPTLEFPPGAQVVVNFEVPAEQSQPHNIHFGPPIEMATEVLEPGASETIEFTVPEEPGQYEYWCDPHRALGMAGSYVITEVAAVGEDPAEGEPPAGEEAPEQEAAEDETPGFTGALALAAVGAATVAFRRRRR